LRWLVCLSVRFLTGLALAALTLGAAGTAACATSYAPQSVTVTVAPPLSHKLAPSVAGRFDAANRSSAGALDGTVEPWPGVTPVAEPSGRLVALPQPNWPMPAGSHAAHGRRAPPRT
jgi:hypothetical protein